MKNRKETYPKFPLTVELFLPSLLHLTDQQSQWNPPAPHCSEMQFLWTLGLGSKEFKHLTYFTVTKDKECVWGGGVNTKLKSNRRKQHEESGLPEGRIRKPDD